MQMCGLPKDRGKKEEKRKKLQNSSLASAALEERRDAWMIPRSRIARDYVLPAAFLLRNADRTRVQLLSTVMNIESLWSGSSEHADVIQAYISEFNDPPSSALGWVFVLSFETFIVPVVNVQFF